MGENVDLLQNPFHILTATPRDNHARIMDLADERSLLLDAEECMAARLSLTTPRKRLVAEVAWLPGIGPKRAEEVLSLLEFRPADILTEDKLLPAARANALAAALSRLSEYSAGNIAKWILELAEAFEEIEPEKLKNLINEERIVAGFPEVTDLSALEEEIQERRRYYRQVIKAALDNLASKELVAAVTDAVESATDVGEEHCPILIADLVDAYEVDAQEFLDREEENIVALIEKLRTAVDAESDDSVLEPMVNRLIQVVKNWDFVAQPIQVSTKSQGLDHDASIRVAKTLRSLAIYMFNEHEKLELCQRLTSMLQEVFAEVVEIAELTANDADTLDEIAEREKLSNVLKPISNLCGLALESAAQNPQFADQEARKVISTAPQLIKNLSASNPGTIILSQAYDEIAVTLMHCSVAYGNETQKWKPCVTFLEEAIKYAKSQDVKSKIQRNLGVAIENDNIFGDLEPISSAPSLSTINGIGVTLYGSTDHDPASGSYIATYYFTFFWVPILPISRYRVISNGNSYRFLGKAPLRTFDKCHLAVSLGLIALVLINML